MKPGAVVVTNLAGEIGPVLAREICARGHATVGLSARQDDLDAAAEMAGPLFKGFICDMASPDTVGRAFADLRTQFGFVRVLVNCPPLVLRRDILDETTDSFMASINHSLGSVVVCTREALLDMVARGEGRILTICPPAAVGPALVASIVSQQAIRTFSHALVADLADRFLRIVVSDWVPSVLDGQARLAELRDLNQAGRWGATLALAQEASLNGTAWIDDREMRPQRSLRRWAADRLSGRVLRPRSIAELDDTSLISS